MSKDLFNSWTHRERWPLILNKISRNFIDTKMGNNSNIIYSVRQNGFKSH